MNVAIVQLEQTQTKAVVPPVHVIVQATPSGQGRTPCVGIVIIRPTTSRPCKTFVRRYVWSAQAACACQGMDEAGNIAHGVPVNGTRRNTGESIVRPARMIGINHFGAYIPVEVVRHAADRAGIDSRVGNGTRGRNLKRAMRAEIRVAREDVYTRGVRPIEGGGTGRSLRT